FGYCALRPARRAMNREVTEFTSAGLSRHSVGAFRSPKTRRPKPRRKNRTLTDYLRSGRRFHDQLRKLLPNPSLRLRRRKRSQPRKLRNRRPRNAQQRLAEPRRAIRVAERARLQQNLHPQRKLNQLKPRQQRLRKRNLLSSARSPPKPLRRVLRSHRLRKLRLPV